MIPQLISNKLILCFYPQDLLCPSKAVEDQNQKRKAHPNESMRRSSLRQGGGPLLSAGVSSLPLSAQRPSQPPQHSQPLMLSAVVGAGRSVNALGVGLGGGALTSGTSCDSSLALREAPAVTRTASSGATSGVGILEFAPDKAGRDITPANLSFPRGRDLQPRECNSENHCTHWHINSVMNFILARVFVNLCVQYSLI